MQGAVYGHANINFSRAWGVGRDAKLRGMCRGWAFGAARDVVSQGVPFLLADAVAARCCACLLPLGLEGADGDATGCPVDYADQRPGASPAQPIM